MFYFSALVWPSVKQIIFVLSKSKMQKYAIIDVETTGGTARYERITEIAIVIHDGTGVVDTYSTLINPERSIPWNITQLTGITDEMVASAPRFFEVARQIVELTEGAIFVAHNVSFDYSFIREEFARLGYTYSRKQLCTVRLARKVFPGLGSYSLSNLKRHFNIYADRSHRALDDTLATVRIFELILEAQQGADQVKMLVNHGVRETKLPQNISLERLHAAPESCGVYYLHDENGQTIYVGKSINIKKRLFEHFADQTPKGEKMRAGVADFSFEITGSELVALLLESAEIKRLQPRINRALRLRRFAGAIFTYTDQNGYQCLAAGKRTKRNAQKLDLVADFPKLESARAYLDSLVRQYELCGRLCNLDHGETACFHYTIKKCFGACVGVEPPESYNARVDEAMLVLSRGLSGSFVLLEDGRLDGEKAVVAVQDGQYLGFGFVDSDGSMGGVELLESVSLPFADPDAARIIRGYMDSRKRITKIRL
ncbi:MAG: DNA polymerase III subunit epsilon [Bacteroidetes bacterium]|nr:MAG: DNA polymerase III subunit epsilon [Bacteroidota bacterium]